MISKGRISKRITPFSAKADAVWSGQPKKSSAAAHAAGLGSAKQPAVRLPADSQILIKKSSPLKNAAESMTFSASTAAKEHFGGIAQAIPALR